MVGDINHIDAVFDGQFGVFRGLHAFEDKRQSAAFAHTCHGVPGQAGLVNTQFFAITFDARWPPAGDQLAFASSVIGGIDRQAECRIPRIARAVDNIIDPIRIAPDIDLKYFGMIRRLRNFLQRGFRHGADQVHGTEFSGSLGDRNPAFRGNRLERADRRQQAGDPQFVPHKCSAGIDLADIAQDARAQSMTVEAMTVPAERGFGFRGTCHIIPHRPAGVIAGGDDDLMHRGVVFRHLVVLSDWAGIPGVSGCFLTLLMPSDPLNSHWNLAFRHIN